MKLHEIKPLKETMRFNNLPQDRLDATIQYVQDHGVHTGDQDSKEIYVAELNGDLIYGIMNDDKITSFFSMSKEKDAEGYTLSKVSYTVPAYRGKQDLRRLWWFCKNDEKLKFISSGIQSDSGQELAKSLDRCGRFEMYWYNIDTKEKVKYDGAADVFPSKYRTQMGTKWRIVTEAFETQVFESRYMHTFGRMWNVFGEDDE